MFFFSQVLQMARFVHRRGGQEPALFLYMPLIREYLELLSEKDIKDSILRAGGANNASGVFLQQNCREATQVTSKTGVNRRSVSIVPQTSIAPDLLKRIKRGT